MSGSFRWIRVTVTAAALVYVGIWTIAQDDLGEIEALLRDLGGDALEEVADEAAPAVVEAAADVVAEAAAMAEAAVEAVTEADDTADALAALEALVGDEPVAPAVEEAAEAVAEVAADEGDVADALAALEALAGDDEPAAPAAEEAVEAVAAVAADEGDVADALAALEALAGDDEPVVAAAGEGDVGDALAALEALEAVDDDPVAEVVVEKGAEAVATEALGVDAFDAEGEEPQLASDDNLEVDDGAIVSAEAGDDAKIKLISELETLERMRRLAKIEHGRANLIAGQNALKAANFEDAKLQFGNALQYIPDTPSTRDLRDHAAEGLSETYYQNALVLRKKGLLEQSLAEARSAQEKGHERAGRLIAQVQKDLEIPPPKAEIVEVPRISQLEYKESREDVAIRMRRARQYYIVGEYDKARDEVELVIKDHRYNTEAVRLLHRIAERMHDVSTQEAMMTRERMLRDVTAAWTPDRYGMDVSVSVDTQTIRDKPEQAMKPAGGGLSVEQDILKKMQDIIIPEINFRNANITDVITFFETSSREYDNPDTPPERRGVNFVLKTSGLAAPAAAVDTLDPFASAIAPAETTGGIPITFSARFVTLLDALKTVMDVANMKFRVKGTIVTIMSANIPDTDLLTRSYNVLPTLTERILSTSREMGGRGGDDSGFGVTTDMNQTTDWKGFFGDMGVNWPEGSAISYLSTIGKLRVSNTADNLSIFEQVLEELNVTPRQIEIEARFVEVAQEDLNSLGFEWILQGNLGINTGIGSLDTIRNSAYDANNVLGNSLLGLGKKGNLIVDGGGAGGSWVDTIIPGGTDPITGLALPGTTARTWKWNDGVPQRSFGRGMRFLNTAGNGVVPDQGTRADDLLQLTAAIDGNALSMILHALSQQTSTDLLSAPKVVTKSGQEAIMKVVTEYIYPTEFEVIDGRGETSGRDGGAAMNMPAVEPQNFDMREVGVILQVLPEVSAEGQMINLTMNPQVVSDPVWKDYGYDVTALVDGEAVVSHLPMEQPWFKVRSVSTSISIYNGATVVMGGMITEERVATFDKIPILGDIPFIGRLFQNKAERTQKRNLLIFVTARLVDPAGRPVKTASETKVSEALSDTAAPGPAMP